MQRYFNRDHKNNVNKNYSKVVQNPSLPKRSEIDHQILFGKFMMRRSLAEIVTRCWRWISINVILKRNIVRQFLSDNGYIYPKHPLSIL